MRKAIFSILFVVVLLAVAVIAEATAGKIPRIGYLTAGSLSSPLRPPASRLSGRVCGNLGYLEGKNIVIEYRYAEGKLDRVPALAAELVRLKVDTSSPPGIPTRSAKAATVRFLL